MGLRSLALLALLALAGATGCESAKIKDVYLSLDGDGHRRSDCIKPTKNGSPNHYFVFVELLSFKDDTLLTPVLRDETTKQYLSWDQTEPQNSELLEFGNIAPGKSEVTISWEQLGAAPPIGQNNYGPIPIGYFAWEFYLDDHSSPDDRLSFTVSDNCK